MNTHNFIKKLFYFLEISLILAALTGYLPDTTATLRTPDSTDCVFCHWT